MTHMTAAFLHSLSLSIIGLKHAGNEIIVGQSGGLGCSGRATGILENGYISVRDVNCRFLCVLSCSEHFLIELRLRGPLL